jgi:hypothetical protein
MKLEFTRAEIERIILVYTNALIPGQHFNTVEGSGYRNLPDTITVSVITKEEDAAQ